MAGLVAAYLGRSDLRRCGNRIDDRCPLVVAPSDCGAKREDSGVANTWSFMLCLIQDDRFFEGKLWMPVQAFVFKAGGFVRNNTPSHERWRVTRPTTIGISTPSG